MLILNANSKCFQIVIISHFNKCRSICNCIAAKNVKMIESGSLLKVVLVNNMIRIVGKFIHTLMLQVVDPVKACELIEIVLLVFSIRHYWCPATLIFVVVSTFRSSWLNCTGIQILNPFLQKAETSLDSMGSGDLKNFTICCDE